jgi:predicted nucleotidyltransferase component of viral defense system
MSNPFGNAYEQQVRLLLEVLPILNRHPQFALKGGTAINLFVRNFPRLSVDIDLAYLPIASRSDSVAGINNALRQIALAIPNAISNAMVKATKPFDSGKEIKLLVELSNIIIKIEPNYILRGTVFPPTARSLSQECAEHFGISLIANIVSTEDLYAGKICAALDRQHPRDLFDIHFLLQNEGITEGIRQAFLVYLMSHNRPMNELLNPNWQDLARIFETEFLGMTKEALTLEELKAAGIRLVATLRRDLTHSERKFLIDFKNGNPNWEHFFKPDVQNFPGILWKQKNLNAMPFEKRRQAVQRLEVLLF